MLLPKTALPTQEQIRQWLNYSEQKIMAKRFAMRAVVYSDHSIEKTIQFSLNKYDVSLHFAEKTPQMVFGGEQKYFPAFICELISKDNTDQGRMGTLFDLHNALDRIMPLMGFDYELGRNFEMWQDYGGQWLPVQASTGVMRMQNSHSDVPNSRIYELVAVYETLAMRPDDRSQKFSRIPQLLREAASLASFATNHGLLAYYKIIEIIADDVLTPPLDKRHHTQQEKMSGLLKRYPHTFNVANCIKISVARNKLAHSSNGNGFHKEAWLCKEIALWAAEQIALDVLTNSSTALLDAP